MSGIAVVSGSRMGAAGGRRADLAGWPTWPALDTVADAAAGMDAHLVYVVRAGELDAGAALVGWELEPMGEGAGGAQWRYRLTRSSDGRVVWVMFVELDDGRVGGPWGGLEAVDLVKSFAAFERLTGVCWAESVGRTAEQLMLSTHPRSRGGVQLDAFEIPEPARGSSLEMPYTRWRRELSEIEAAAPFVHTFDASAQYLSAWITAELGHGRAEHRQGSLFDKSRAGVWRIPGIDQVTYPGILPAPWLPQREWFSTPTVVRMFETADAHGLELPDITEAWVWPHHSRWLRRAGEKLRDARAAARGEVADAKQALAGAVGHADEISALCARVAVADAVSDAVKLVYATGTGRLGAELPGRDTSSPWYRPDWGHTVRAQARVNLHRRLEQLARVPFAIEIDGLMFASREPDGLVFAEAIGLPIGDGLGHFRHVATLPTDDPSTVTFAAVRAYLRNREAVPA